MTRRQYKLLRFIHRHKPTFRELSEHMGYASLQMFYDSEEWWLLFDDEVEKYTVTDAFDGICADTRITLNSEGIKAVENRFTDLFRWRVTTAIAVAALILSVIALITQ